MHSTSDVVTPPRRASRLVVALSAVVLATVLTSCSSTNSSWRPPHPPAAHDGDALVVDALGVTDPRVRLQ
jgi:hypothetical protein